MTHFLKTMGFVVGAGVMLVAADAQAQPAEVMASGAEDDASLDLTMREQLIISDPLVWCQIDVVVLSILEPLTEGDTVDVFLIEDDLFGNDEVWTEQHIISAGEAAAGTYQESFDCSAMGKKDGVGSLEFFAQVEVDKAACGALCLQDNPATDNVDVDGITDDDFEDDDAPGQAGEATLDAVEERAAADADFVRVLLAETGSIDAQIEFMAACGEVEVEILDEDDAVVGPNEAGTDAASASAEDLPAGAYFVRVAAADPGNLNFYDLTVTASEDPGATTGGETEGDGSGSDGSGTDSGPDSMTASDSNADSNSASASNSASGGTDSNGDDSSPGDGTAGGGSDADTDGDSAGGAGDDDGCGCRAPVGGSAWLWLLLVLPAVRRR